ncbi:MAG: hypothetical protein GF417_04280 [Candidatus Latescibacteria bacterium]|nr:hypothetical protein [bacterium]MBD3423644.1 hypothetical protein [Candidatus Latescibacterota bacterium]
MKRYLPLSLLLICMLVSCSENPSSLDLHHYREDPLPEPTGNISGIFRIDPSDISHFASVMRIGLDLIELESGEDMEGIELDLYYGYNSSGIYFRLDYALDDWFHREGKFYVRRFDGDVFSSGSPTRCDFILNIKDLPLGTYTMYLEYRLDNTSTPLTKVVPAEVAGGNTTLGEVILDGS